MPAKQAFQKKPSSKIVLQRCLQLALLVGAYGHVSEGLTRRQIYNLVQASKIRISQRTAERYIAALACLGWFVHVFKDEEDSDTPQYRYAMDPKIYKKLESVLA